MTREEAIEVLKDIYNYTRFDTYTTNEARTMAIKALEQEPCDDCVSRQAVIGYLKRTYNSGMGKKKSQEYNIEYVSKLPSVNPTRAHGEWIEVHPLQEDDGGAYMCSKCRCGHPYIAPHWKYCPNCGADMRTESEDKE